MNDTPCTLPLSGLRVVEMTHMVMGPTCGLILGDLGAEVIKIEPPAGDNTRRLLGSGAGFFPMFNRNKKSLAIDTRDPRGRELVRKLVATADVFSENFKPGAMERLGLDYAQLSAIHPGLVYVSHKGFLPGPYEHRTALDEVVQMMGGLAYMTGPQGRPLRAGGACDSASVRIEREGSISFANSLALASASVGISANTEAALSLQTMVSPATSQTKAAWPSEARMSCACGTACIRVASFRHSRSR